MSLAVEALVSVPMSLVERKCHDSETALCHLCAGPVLRLDARHLGSRGQALPSSVLLPSRLRAAGGLPTNGMLSARGDLLRCASRLHHPRSGTGLQWLRSRPGRATTRRASGTGSASGRSAAPKLARFLDPCRSRAWAVPESDSRPAEGRSCFREPPVLLLSPESQAICIFGDNRDAHHRVEPDSKASPTVRTI